MAKHYFIDEKNLGSIIIEVKIKQQNMKENVKSMKENE